jgi:hypothetical protein
VGGSIIYAGGFVHTMAIGVAAWGAAYQGSSAERVDRKPGKVI